MREKSETDVGKKIKIYSAPHNALIPPGPLSIITLGEQKQERNTRRRMKDCCNDRVPVGFQPATRETNTRKHIKTLPIMMSYL